MVALGFQVSRREFWWYESCSIQTSLDLDTMLREIQNGCGNTVQVFLLSHKKINYVSDLYLFSRFRVDFSSNLAKTRPMRFKRKISLWYSNELRSMGYAILSLRHCGYQDNLIIQKMNMRAGTDDSLYFSFIFIFIPILYDFKLILVNGVPKLINLLFKNSNSLKIPTLMINDFYCEYSF